MSAVAHIINTESDDYPLDRRSCQLLGPTALVVQALMGLLVVLSLVYKRQREPRKRPWKIWLFDVSKQVFGQMFVHGLNVLISHVGSHRLSGNACTYYFLNILIDATLGVAFIYLALQATTWLLSKTLQLKGLQSGQYGDPPSFQHWGRQTAVYVFVLTTMKFLIVMVLTTWPRISELGDWLLSWTTIGNGEAFQLVFVMGIFPIFMNIMQFWLIDSIVKYSEAPLDPNTPGRSDAQDREPLFRPSTDDEVSRCDIESASPSSVSGMPSEVTTVVGIEDDKAKSLGSILSSPMVSSGSVSPTTHDNHLDSPGSSTSQSTSPRCRQFPSPSLQHKSAFIAELGSPNPSSRAEKSSSTWMVSHSGETADSEV